MTAPRRPDLAAQLRDMQQRLDRLERNNRLAAASFSGLVQMIAQQTGVPMFVVGELPAGTDVPGGWYGGAGVVIRRQTGAAVLVAGNLAGLSEFWALYDLQGNIVVGDDAASGHGLARPYITIPFIRADQATWASVTSGSFVDSHYAVHNVQHPRLSVYVQTTCDAGTTGQIKVTSGGADIAGPVDVPEGAGSFVLEADSPAGFGGVVDLHVAARRASGSGAMRLNVTGAWGRQT